MIKVFILLLMMMMMATTVLGVCNTDSTEGQIDETGTSELLLGAFYPDVFLSGYHPTNLDTIAVHDPVFPNGGRLAVITMDQSNNGTTPLPGGEWIMNPISDPGPGFPDIVSLSVGDANSDGIQDVLFAVTSNNPSSSGAFVLFGRNPAGNGQAYFEPPPPSGPPPPPTLQDALHLPSPPSSFYGGTHSWIDVQSADVNDDGIPDIIGLTNVSLHIWEGPIPLAPGPPIPSPINILFPSSPGAPPPETGYPFKGMALGRFDDNPGLDLALVHNTTFISILYSSGDLASPAGIFSFDNSIEVHRAGTYTFGPTNHLQLLATDFNGDSLDDLVVGTTRNTVYALDNGVHVWLNAYAADPDLVFDTPFGPNAIVFSPPNGGTSIKSINLIDIDFDNVLDLVLVLREDFGGGGGGVGSVVGVTSLLAPGVTSWEALSTTRRLSRNRDDEWDQWLLNIYFLESKLFSPGTSVQSADFALGRPHPRGPSDPIPRYPYAVFHFAEFELDAGVSSKNVRSVEHLAGVIHKGSTQSLPIWLGLSPIAGNLITIDDEAQIEVVGLEISTNDDGSFRTSVLFYTVNDETGSFTSSQSDIFIEFIDSPAALRRGRILDLDLSGEADLVMATVSSSSSSTPMSPPFLSTFVPSDSLWAIVADDGSFGRELLFNATAHFNGLPLRIEDFDTGDVTLDGIPDMVCALSNGVGERAPQSLIVLRGVLTDPQTGPDSSGFKASYIAHTIAPPTPGDGLPLGTLPTALGLASPSSLPGTPRSLVVSFVPKDRSGMWIVMYQAAPTIAPYFRSPQVVATSHPAGTTPGFLLLEVKDLDGDGSDEIVMAYSVKTGIQMVLSTLGPSALTLVDETTFSPAYPNGGLVLHPTLTSLQLADLNGDGAHDIWVSTVNGTQGVSMAAMFLGGAVVGSTSLSTDFELHPSLDHVFDDGSPSDVLGTFAAFIDVNRDGLPDLVSTRLGLSLGLPFGSQQGAALTTIETHPGLVLRPPYRPSATLVRPTVCGGSLSCIIQTIEAVSPCGTLLVDILIPDGVYKGCSNGEAGGIYLKDEAAVALRSQVFAQGGVAGGVTFDCARRPLEEGTGRVLLVQDTGFALLEGIRVRNGRQSRPLQANLEVTPLRVTGGFMFASHLVVESCSAEKLSDSQSLAGFGAALIDSGATAWILHSEFTDNRATEGGNALAVIGDNTNALIVDTVFENNGVLNNLAAMGGAVYVGGGKASAVFDQCVFEGNAASGVGGAMAVDGTGGYPSVTVSDSSFSFNYASMGGAVGMIRMDDGLSGIPNEPDVLVTTRCSFDNNVAQYGAVFGTSSNGATAFESADPEDMEPTSSGRDPKLDDPTRRVPLRCVNSTMDANGALYGGVIFACGSYAVFQQVEVTSILPEFDVSIYGYDDSARGGGFGFACRRNDMDPFASDVDTPWVYLDQSTRSHLAPVLTNSGNVTSNWGRLFATPPFAAVLTMLGVPNPVETNSMEFVVQSGETLVSKFGTSSLLPSVVVKDALGHRVEDGMRVTFTVQGGIAGEPGAEIAAGPTVASMLTGSVRLAPFAVSLPLKALRSSPQGTDVRMTIRVDGDTSSNVGDATVVFTVMPCGPFDSGNTGNTDVDVAQVLCSTCTFGTYSNSSTLESCQPFPLCPSNSIRPETNNATQGPGQVAGSSYLVTQPCLCLSGFYAASGVSDTTCTVCPQGGVCAGGVAQPKAESGWYDVSGDGDGSQFAECQRPGACPGGVQGTCNEGYEGFMCNSCSTGYYTDTTGACTKCPSAGVRVMFVMCIIGAVLVFVACLMFVLVTSAPDTGEVSKARGIPRKRKVPYALSSAAIFLQIVSIVGVADFGWPTSFSRTTSAVASVVNLDLNVFASECSLASFSGKYIMSVLLPMAIVGIFVIVALVTKYVIRSMTEVSLLRIFERGVLVGGPLLYIPLARTSLVLWDCSAVPNRSGEYTLDADPGVACFSSEWFALLPVGIFAAVAYVLAIPCFIGYQLWTHQDSLNDPATIAHLGSVYRLYRVSYFFYELIGLGRRLAIVCAALFLSKLQLLQFVSLFLVFGWSLGFLVSRAPYYNVLYNKLEERLAGILLFLVFIGSAFYADRFPNTGTEILFLVAAFGCLGGGVVVLGWAFFREMTDIRNNADPSEARYDAFIKTALVESGDWPELMGVVETIPRPGKGVEVAAVGEVEMAEI